MKKYISKNKLSKKKQREINALARKTWTCNPVTHIAKDYSKYDRNAIRKTFRKELSQDV